MLGEFKSALNSGAPLLRCGAMSALRKFLGPAVFAVAFSLGLETAIGAGDDEPAEKDTRYRVEVKRQNTNRGTPGESTKTTLRLEALPQGRIALLRLDVPFPDDKSSYSGDLFNPKLGDIKLRAKTRPFDASPLPLATYVEATFPTADPESLGQGKYQLTLGVDSFIPLGSIKTASGTQAFSFSPLVEQTVSVAGDPDRPDINYTKFELAARDVWNNYSLKFTVKPVIDWEKDADTGAVGELEAGVRFGRGWTVLLMLGGRLWGESVASTYDKRTELTVRYLF